MKENRQNLILLDLFSGIGGFHKGFEDAGFTFSEVYFSEIDKHAIANYNYNFPNAKFIGSVTDILNRGIKRPNIITFGSPCQDFSLAGERKGLSGERSSLIKYALSAISHFKPDLFIWENVKGTFSSNFGADFWAIIQAFANIGGYRIEWQLLNTAWVLPQNRERIYLIGHLTTSERGFTRVFPIGENDKLSEKERKTDKGQSQTEICSTITGKYNRATDTFVIQRERGNNKGNSFKICPTISANSFEHNNFINIADTAKCLTGGGNSGGLHSQMNTICHNTQPGRSGDPKRGGSVNVVEFESNIRRLTEIECERLQGYPDDFTKFGNYDGEVKEISKTQRYKLLGNAVTVKVVELIASRL